MCAEQSQSLCKEILILLTCDIHEIVEERFWRLRQSLRFLFFTLSLHFHLHNNMIRSRDRIHISHTVFSVIEWFPDHRRMWIDMDFYTVIRLLSLYSVSTPEVPKYPTSSAVQDWIHHSDARYSDATTHSNPLACAMPFPSDKPPPQNKQRVNRTLPHSDRFLP